MIPPHINIAYIESGFRPKLFVYKIYKVGSRVPVTSNIAEVSLFPELESFGGSGEVRVDQTRTFNKKVLQHPVLLIRTVDIENYPNIYNQIGQTSYLGYSKDWPGHVLLCWFQRQSRGDGLNFQRPISTCDQCGEQIVGQYTCNVCGDLNTKLIDTHVGIGRWYNPDDSNTFSSSAQNHGNSGESNVTGRARLRQDPHAVATIAQMVDAQVAQRLRGQTPDPVAIEDEEDDYDDEGDYEDDDPDRWDDE